MAPAELGAMLVQTIRQAQAETRERFLRANEPLRPDNTGPDSPVSGQRDVG